MWTHCRKRIQDLQNAVEVHETHLTQVVNSNFDILSVFWQCPKVSKSDTLSVSKTDKEGQPQHPGDTEQATGSGWREFRHRIPGSVGGGGPILGAELPCAAHCSQQRHSLVQGLPLGPVHPAQVRPWPNKGMVQTATKRWDQPQGELHVPAKQHRQ